MSMSKFNEIKEEKCLYDNKNMNNNSSNDEEYDLSFMDEFRFIDGRRFHNENSRYWFPNDKKEVDRLNMQHYLFRYAWQGNFSSPMGERLSNGGVRVLDDHPALTNIGFIKHNVLEGLPFPENTFDYVYQRFLSTAFTPSEWVRDINELVRVTNPDGWIELMEIKFFMEKKGPATKSLAEAYTNQMTDVRRIEKCTPVGKWGGRVGELLALNFVTIIRLFKKFLNVYLKLSDDQFEKLITDHDAQVNEYKSYLVSYRYIGRKL
ncbi:8904_t:CDS:2 [Entrophospora sp. SA101]|nr:11370_t:CDS:2 [Entrophospora sp. SA101]CAJ0843405.1 13304_t:CDS:2 [Entrophospora sp. SA101]CAJ0908127.1 8904_t:CDS:2 [Entrophospora sp. SA101]